jgi:hypothetical protein
VKNSEFLRLVYGPELHSLYGWTASFAADPGEAPPGVWQGSPWYGSPEQQNLIDKRGEDNNYYSVAVMRVVGNRARSKEKFHRLCVLLADDAQPHDMVGPYSFVIQTSPDKYQIGIFLDPLDHDAMDLPLIDNVLKAMADQGYIKADPSGNNIVRYGRLPNGSNTKQRESGIFKTKLLTCNEDNIYTLEDAAASFGIDIRTLRPEPTPKMEIPNPFLHKSVDAVQLLKNILTDDYSERSYHDSLLKLSASMIHQGMNPDATLAFLRSLMIVAKPEANPNELKRWESRIGPELERMVRGAERFSPVRPAIVEGQLIDDLYTLESKNKNVDWLVKNFVPANSGGMLFGASGTFKSFVAIDLAMHVAHGIDWVGKPTKQGYVLYVASEGGTGISRRFKAWNLRQGVDMPMNVGVCSIPLVLNLKEEIDALTSAIEKLKETPALVVIDTLSQTFIGDENSSSDIASYLRMINQEIRSRFNTTVLIIHHTGYSTTERPRGSSALVANMDFLIGCHRVDPEAMSAKVAVLKQKDGDKGEDIWFDMQRTVIGVDEDDEEISSLVAEYSDVRNAVVNSFQRRSRHIIHIEAHLKKHGKISIEEAQLLIMQESKLNPKASRQNAIRIIKKMVETNNLVQVGEWFRIS